jgi:hypothetical protein
MNTTTTSASGGLTVSGAFHVARRGKRKELCPGPVPEVPKGRVPRVSRLMALALRFEELVRDGVVADYAELARLGHVTRARVSQIMNLTLLAPDIQESLLFLSPIEKGRDRIILRNLQPIAMTLDWRKQRKLWGTLAAQSLGGAG